MCIDIWCKLWNLQILWGLNICGIHGYLSPTNEHPRWISKLGLKNIFPFAGIRYYTKLRPHNLVKFKQSKLATTDFNDFTVCTILNYIFVGGIYRTSILQFIEYMFFILIDIKFLLIINSGNSYLLTSVANK